MAWNWSQNSLYATIKTKNMKTLKLAMLVAALAAAGSVSASVTVELVTVNPSETVNIDSSISGDIGVYAGIYNLSVNTVATPSFCIDIGHEENPGTSSSDYSYTTLSSAPVGSAGPMNASGAVDVEKLWAAYFSPTMGAQDAAALQLAIWEAVATGNGTYTVTSNPSGPYYNGAVATEAAGEIASLSHLTAQADLIALTSSTEQNFVVAVPEPTTIMAGVLMLLPFGASTLRILRRKSAV